MLVRLGAAAGIEAQRHLGPYLALARQPVQQAQLVAAFHVEPADAGIQRVGDLSSGFAHAGEDNPRRVNARRQRPMNLPSAHRVHAQARLAQQPDEGQAGIRFQAVVDGRAERGKGAPQPLDVVPDARRAVHVDGRAGCLGDGPQGHAVAT